MNLVIGLNERLIRMPGAGQMEAEILGEPLTIFTFFPRGIKTSGILFVFDGLHRNAAGIRDKTARLAERTGLITLAPLMDRERFPKWRYDKAGVILRGEMQPREHWTGSWLQQLIEWARGTVDPSTKRFYLFGHSAGGQMLSRICAYSPLSDIDRVVIANPSAYVAPQLDEPPPFGFAGLFESAEAIARLQVYLALPITIFLGQEDTGERYLVKSKPATRQGENRLARGRFIYSTGRELAKKNAWAFNWRLVEVPRVGHSSRAMLDSVECVDALGLLCK